MGKYLPQKGKVRENNLCLMAIVIFTDLSRFHKITLLPVNKTLDLLIFANQLMALVCERKESDMGEGEFVGYQKVIATGLALCQKTEF